MDGRDVADLLDERPDLEPALRAVLDTDPPWTFDDIEVDSGAFGELVSRGVVEEHEHGYRVADPDAVRSALVRPDKSQDASGDTESRWLTRRSYSLDRESTIAVAGALLFVALLRLISYPKIFHGEEITLSGNDPYYYRFWVERIIASDQFTATALPDQVTNAEPLFVAVLSFAADTAGGTETATGIVLACYPVVVAVVTGLLTYTLVTTVTNDKRVALAALLLFALTPGHAFRTSLGFADHHAFDYVWLVTTVLAATVLVAETTRHDASDPIRAVLGSIGMAVGIAGQILAWEAGPLLVVPLGAYVAIDGLLGVDTGRSPLNTHLPLLAGIAMGAVLTWTVHTSFGWHTTLVAAVPALLVVGTVGVSVVAELCHRLGLHVGVPILVELLGTGGAVGLLARRYPDRLNRLVVDAETRLLQTNSPAEAGGLFGESLGWLLLFGFVFVLAVPYLVTSTYRMLDRPVWAPLVVYTWSFVLLAAVQIRFIGEMAPFIAVFAGVGFVSLAAWVDIIESPPVLTGSAPEAVRSLTVPDQATLKSLTLLLLLVGSLSFVQIPVKTSQLTYTDAQYEAASWMAGDAEDRTLDYPDSYVLSRWGDNRFYNYHVNGESASFRFARATYGDFVFGTNGERWYQRLKDRAGYVVLTDATVGNDSTLGTRLYRSDGSMTDSAPGLQHYRLVQITGDGRYKVFSLVQGARLHGTGPANETVTVKTEVTVGSYTTTYTQQTRVKPSGEFSIIVPYPGTYRVRGTDVLVSERAVQSGARVTVE
ncbi:STT3 domain-containing protein [Halobaculum sp. MBLA0147]|uniref:STT3 domain-containing protein n=1 Tax=Halobaculum sp. MBLA0147 TaxID=3079934 RepID=UPI00352687D1